jgi:hypothetical protein
MTAPVPCRAAPRQLTARPRRPPPLPALRLATSISEIDGELAGKLRALLIDMAPPAALADLDEAFVDDGAPPGTAESDAS